MLLVGVEDVSLRDRARAWRPWAGRPPATFSSISAMPWSPETGRAPWRLNLKPLYCAGLWLAVTCTPPAALRWPIAK